MILVAAPATSAQDFPFGSSPDIKESQRNGKITKLVWKGKELRLGMQYREFEELVPRALYSSATVSDGTAVFFSPEGMDTKLKSGMAIYLLGFSVSSELVRIEKTVVPVEPQSPSSWTGRSTQAQSQEPPRIPQILIPHDSMPITGLKIKAGVPLELTECVAKYLGPEQRIFKVIGDNFPASPSGGESGRGFFSDSSEFAADWGSLDLALDESEKKRRESMKFVQGELVRLGRAEDFFSKGEHLIQVTRTDSGRW